MGTSPSEPKCPTFCVRHFCECLQMACTKTIAMELMNVSGLRGLNHWTVAKKSYRIFWSLFGVLEVRDGLDRTGEKNRYKTAKIACIGMCSRIHFLDLQHLYMFRTADLMTVSDPVIKKAGLHFYGFCIYFLKTPFPANNTLDMSGKLITASQTINVLSCSAALYVLNWAGPLFPILLTLYMQRLSMR